MLDCVDLVLVMTVNPGFSGNPFLLHRSAKIHRIRSMIGDKPILLPVDGGITGDTATGAIAAAADVLVDGSAVFRGQSHSDYAGNIAAIRMAANAGPTRDFRVAPAAG